MHGIVSRLCVVVCRHRAAINPFAALRLCTDLQGRHESFARGNSRSSPDPTPNSQPPPTQTPPTQTLAGGHESSLMRSLKPEHNCEAEWPKNNSITQAQRIRR